MLRLQEFITIIRNTKTIAEERAEYQKEMAAIRESFAVTHIQYLETRRIPQTQKCHQASLHQHVRTVNKLRPNGVP